METQEQTLASVLSNSAAPSKTDAELTLTQLQLIVIKVADVEYGINIDQIKEVVITPPISRLPNTPTYVKGVANIRGNIIAIIDLAERFNLIDPKQSDVKNSANYTLVAESEKVKLGILVEEVPQTLAVTSKDVDLSPDVAFDDRQDEQYIKGIVKDNDRLIVLIDLFKLVNTEREKAQAA